MNSGDFWSLPALRVPSMFDEMDDLLSFPQTQSNGLSISEDDKNVYVEAAIPGINPKDIEVTMDRAMLWIRGQAREEEQDKKRKFYRRAAQEFSYRIAIPKNVDANVEPQVSYENGMIRITLAKTPQTPPKKLTVKVRGRGEKESKSK